MGALSGLSGLSGISGIAGELPPSPDLPYSATLLADYRFDDGSGTTLTDYSGNGFHGTLGSGTTPARIPTWSSSGLVYDGSQMVRTSLPSLDAVTVIAFATLDSTAYAQAWHTLLGDDQTDRSGLLWSYSNYDVYPAGTSASLSRAMIGQDAATYGTRMSIPPYQSVVAYVEGDAPDKVYYDGVAGGTRGYFNQRDTFELRRGGNLNIGAPCKEWFDFGVLGLKGTFHRLCIFDGVLTAQQVLDNSRAIKAYAAYALGAGTTFTNPTTTRTLNVEGDSIAAGTDGASWVERMTLAQTWVRRNWGISGQWQSEIVTDFPRRSAPMLNAPSAPKVVAMFPAYINDILNGRTAAQIVANLQTNVTLALSKGSNVYVIIPPCLSWPSQDTAKNTLNSLIEGTSWDSRVTVMGAAALSAMTADGLSFPSTYFAADGHPNATGYQYMADQTSPYIDAIG